MDAQQRLLLEGCWEALGRSTLGATGALSADEAKAVGVTVGISYNEYYLNSAHQVGWCGGGCGWVAKLSLCPGLTLRGSPTLPQPTSSLATGHDGIHCHQRHAVGGLRPHFLHPGPQGGCLWIPAGGAQCSLACAAPVSDACPPPPCLPHPRCVQGPSVSIDTACSSSLVGAHLAATSFLPGGCSRALATGVNLTMRAETTAVLSRAGMLTADGRCKTLDASADGYMRGEACVVHLLEVALESGAPPPGAAVVLGTAVNQDGRSSSLTAPNGPSQQAVVRSALAWGEVAARDVGALEMHGTGTALGDPIEVGAAFAVFQVRPAAGAGLPGLDYACQQRASAPSTRRPCHVPAAGAGRRAASRAAGRRVAQPAHRARCGHCGPCQPGAAPGLYWPVRAWGSAERHGWAQPSAAAAYHMPPPAPPSTCRHHILHLRTINPHVHSVFDGHASQPGSRGWMARRQDAPMLRRCEAEGSEPAAGDGGWPAAAPWPATANSLMHLHLHLPIPRHAALRRWWAP